MPVEDSAAAGCRIRGVVVVGVGGVVHDLGDVFRVGAFDEADVRPPVLEVGADLDELVLILVVGFAEMIPAADLGDHEAVVTVVLAIEGPAEVAVRLGDAFIEDSVDVGMPEAAVEVERVSPHAGAGEGGGVAAAVGAIEMGDP